MADAKISALVALVGSGVDVANDVLPIVDTSATATKKITITELFKSASLAFNGTVGATTPAAGAFTTLGGTLTTAAQPNVTSLGTLTTELITSKAGQFFSRSGVSTSNQYFNVSNTSGSFFLGVESSAGGSLLTGSTAYCSVFTTQGAKDLFLGTNLTYALKIDGTTQAATFAGSLGVTTTLTTGNPAGGTAAAVKFGVAAATAITSPDKCIQVDVAGTLYYVPAKLTAN